MEESQIKQPVVKPNVFRAGTDYAGMARHTMMLAFSADPQLRWLWPESDAYVANGPKLFDGFGRNAFKSGTAFYARDFSVVSLWLSPGVHIDEEGLRNNPTNHLRRTS